MGSPTRAPAVRDRASDPRTAVDGLTKPPVLGRGTLRVLCVLCLALIVYGTLGPLQNTPGPWLVPAETWRWVPQQQPSDINDVATNLAVYVPVGIAFRLLVRRRGRAGVPDLLLGLTLSALLSYVTELCQQALPTRSSNLIDVYVNSFAALIGCSLAVPLQRAARRLHELVFVDVHRPQRPWAVMAWFSIAAAAVLMTVPWNLAPPAAESGFANAFELADLRRFAMFAVVGLFVGGTRLAGTTSRWKAVLATLAQVTLIGGCLEAAQAVLGAHTCSLRDALVAATGGGLGCAIATRLLRPGRTKANASDAPVHRSTSTSTVRNHEEPQASACAAPRGLKPAAPQSMILENEALAGRCHTRPSEPPSDPRRRWTGTRLRRPVFVGLAVTLAYMLVTGLWDGGQPGGIRGEPVVRWIPFQQQYAAPFAITLANVIEQFALYGSVTLLCLFLAPRRGPAIALLLLVGMLGTLEICHAFMVNHVADTTAPLLATLAWAITTRAWRGIHPAVAPDTSAIA